ncbi:sodium:proton antiporter [Virgibacillus halodenitrificans]|uniref:Sodium:proton antiporter n=1 Tax=Virgibacillus halodenitrificans TaxID=1482 RepID=A0ABR7VNF9_VIRHA|nr:sodium:proton antiporter [Virgibacillus halodenitrificans]MBD1223449.1 sodium:proton antiporter [Virgibacillus halodenitrificans]MCG1029196.1 sodium:proton antiporter [Virgibacillus halodenitrificans]MCJ0932806.1 cation:proton antiporter [Virgibacillus halodenitrificans]MEC2157953.1 sodium:proton antiporter [Virgibacillus halodenitrificans]MYL47474.1 sodium:proton antiporter [Virgibacillus halodenitrificans]
MVPSLLFEVMLIGLLGIGSQWIAWRYRMPAIVVMSITGLLAGPILGILNPEEDFGDLYNPIISVAVAIILFEGSLNLSFKEIRGLGKPVFRISTVGAFIAWILGSLTAHYIAGLSWAVAFIIGALFIVTGPTVIMPLLRQSKLRARPAKILKWEGIIVDPIGALLAVFAFEIISFMTATDPSGTKLILFFTASLFAVIFGWACGRGIGWMFETGHIPEFLKSPAVVIVVILCFTGADEIMHETGLLSVTAMGITLANMGISSISDMRHFKENISILLISTIFIMLTASLQVETLLQIFSPRIIGYVLLMMFIVRPLSIFLSTIGTGMSFNEKVLVGWIAPRGIVALTVSGYFASILQSAGYEDAEILTTLTFGLVFFTVIAHGFSIGWLSKKLHLSMEGRPGTLIIGANRFTVELAKTLTKVKIPVIIVDSSWERLRAVRESGINFYHGNILSEQTEYNLDTIPYEYMIAMTDDHAYNALVCTTFMPEYGRTNVFKISPYTHSEVNNSTEIVSKVGGRILFDKKFTMDDLNDKLSGGYVFRQTTLTSQYNYKQYVADKDNSTVFLYLIKPSGQLKFYSEEMRTVPSVGDTIISLTPPNKEKAKIEAKLENQRNSINGNNKK